MNDSIKKIVTQTIENLPAEITESESALFNSLPQSAISSALKEVFYAATDKTIQSRAFDAILKLNSYDPVEFLIEVFDLCSFEWKDASCKRLASQKDSRAILKLCDILMNDDNPDIRYNAAESLGEVGDMIALGYLEHARTNDTGTDYEGFPISDVAEDSINKILARNPRQQ